MRDIDLSIVHFLSGPIGVKGAEPGDLLVVDLLDVGALKDSLWGFNGFFSKKNGGGFLTDHFPLAQKSIWDFKGMFTSSRHIPGVNFAGLIHPGLIGCLPDPKTAGDLERARDRADRDQPDPRAGPRQSAVRARPRMLGKAKGDAKAKVGAEGARTVPPREHGGNCDIKDLSRGSKIYFPVYVRAAGLSMGDLHFSQGDGEITFCGAIEMAGWVHMKVDLIKGGMAKYGIKNPIFKPSPITPNYNDYLIFEGISVDEAGKQHYLDVHIAYRQACLNAIEYLKKFGYSGAQAYSILGTAPCRATSPAWSTSRTPAPRCGCRRRSSTSTSCRRRRADQVHQGRHRHAAVAGQIVPARGMRDGCVSAAPHPPSRMRQQNRARKTTCRSTNIFATIAARSPTCGRWPNATSRRIARTADEAPRVILTAPNFSCMPADKRKAHATNERSANAPKTLGRVQGLARPRLRLLLGQEAGAAGDARPEAAPRAFPTARPWMISH